MKTLKCNYEMYNPNIVASENCHVIDENGKKYVDFEAGVWAVPLGHNNKRINDSIMRQLNTISHVGYRYTTKIVDEAAAKVLELLGFPDGKCVFLSSGSEAVEFGVQAARRVMDKPYFLCLSNYYLSAYGISQSRSAEQWISLDISEYKGNPEEFLADIPFEKIGAFVFEAGNASGTAKLPPKELIAAIEEKLNNAIIVTDEVTTGIGRTGRWFGYEHYNMRPDIVALGKGIGNGYPVSVICLSKNIAEALEKSGFRYAQSHQDDPLGCAVVSEVISAINENNLIQRAAETGKILKHSLKSLTKKHNCIKEIRGQGLMLVMEFHKKEKFNLQKIHRELFDAGYITGHHALENLLRFYPPLTIEEFQIKNMIDALDICLSKIGA
ncbi:MAG: aspartate aminotransferase family protein [Defluviitaleaceae bacterium]|nr:aspartate aminotransferase family protein [Defluviitaleaceae bacterium]